jgi:hypothetical protein
MRRYQKIGFRLFSLRQRHSIWNGRSSDNSSIISPPATEIAFVTPAGIRLAGLFEEIPPNPASSLQKIGSNE